MEEKLKTPDKDEIRAKIVDMLGKIDDEGLLNRVYRFVKYIYIHKT